MYRPLPFNAASVVKMSLPIALNFSANLIRKLISVI